MTPLGTIDEADLARFWPRVNKNGPVVRPALGPCWVWTGGSDADGYGAFWINGRNHPAHRFSFAITHADPGDACVLHRCDNPPCVRPEHLFTGTKTDNMADKVAKGRQARGPGLHAKRQHATGDRNGSRRYPERLKRGADHYATRTPEKVLRGEKHGRTLLTEAQAKEIKRRAAAGERKPTLAAEFGLKVDVIYSLCSGRTWGHLNEDSKT